MIQVPIYLAFFSTNGGRTPPRSVPASGPSPRPIIHSNPAKETESMISSLRAKYPHETYGIFAKSSDNREGWDIRWYFDEVDFLTFGGQWLYNLVLTMQKQNEEEVKAFVDQWDKVNEKQWPIPIEHLTWETAFCRRDQQKYGPEFLQKAMLHIRWKWRSACQAYGDWLMQQLQPPNTPLAQIRGGEPLDTHGQPGLLADSPRLRVAPPRPQHLTTRFQVAFAPSQPHTQVNGTYRPQVEEQKPPSTLQHQVLPYTDRRAGEIQRGKLRYSSQANAPLAEIREDSALDLLVSSNVVGFDVHDIREVLALGVRDSLSEEDIVAVITQICPVMRVSIQPRINHSRSTMAKIFLFSTEHVRKLVGIGTITCRGLALDLCVPRRYHNPRCPYPLPRPSHEQRAIRQKTPPPPPRDVQVRQSQSPVTSKEGHVQTEPTSIYSPQDARSDLPDKGESPLTAKANLRNIASPETTGEEEQTLDSTTSSRLTSIIDELSKAVPTSPDQTQQLSHTVSSVESVSPAVNHESCGRSESEAVSLGADVQDVTSSQRDATTPILDIQRPTTTDPSSTPPKSPTSVDSIVLESNVQGLGISTIEHDEDTGTDIVHQITQPPFPPCPASRKDTPKSVAGIAELGQWRLAFRTTWEDIEKLPPDLHPTWMDQCRLLQGELEALEDKYSENQAKIASGGKTIKKTCRAKSKQAVESHHERVEEVILLQGRLLNETVRVLREKKELESITPYPSFHRLSASLALDAKIVPYQGIAQWPQVSSQSHRAQSMRRKRSISPIPNGSGGRTPKEPSFVPGLYEISGKASAPSQVNSIDDIQAIQRLLAASGKHVPVDESVGSSPSTVPAAGSDEAEPEMRTAPDSIWKDPQEVTDPGGEVEAPEGTESRATVDTNYIHNDHAQGTPVEGRCQDVALQVEMEQQTTGPGFEHRTVAAPGAQDQAEDHGTAPEAQVAKKEKKMSYAAVAQKAPAGRDPERTDLGANSGIRGGDTGKDKSEVKGNHSVKVKENSGPSRAKSNDPEKVGTREGHAACASGEWKAEGDWQRQGGYRKGG